MVGSLGGLVRSVGEMVGSVEGLVGSVGAAGRSIRRGLVGNVGGLVRSMGGTGWERRGISQENGWDWSGA